MTLSFYCKFGYWSQQVQFKMARRDMCFGFSVFCVLQKMQFLADNALSQLINLIIRLLLRLEKKIP